MTYERSSNRQPTTNLRISTRANSATINRRQPLSHHNAKTLNNSNGHSSSMVDLVASLLPKFSPTKNPTPRQHQTQQPDGPLPQLDKANQRLHLRSAPSTMRSPQSSNGHSHGGRRLRPLRDRVTRNKPGGSSTNNHLRTAAQNAPRSTIMEKMEALVRQLPRIAVCLCCVFVKKLLTHTCSNVLQMAQKRMKSRKSGRL